MTSNRQTPHPGPRSSVRGESPARAPAPSLNRFGDLCQEHVTAVYRYHHARTGCIADAHDLTSETFYSALEGYPRYQPSKGTVIAWLMGIARHKLTDHFRRAPRSVSLEEIEVKPAGRPSPEIEAGQALQVAQVADALRRINPARAEALTLHLYVGLSLEEAGRC